MPIPHKRSPAVVAARQAERQERQQVRALQQDLQAIIDGITPATTLAQLRGFTQDLTRVTRRLLRLLA